MACGNKLRIAAALLTTGVLTASAKDVSPALHRIEGMADTNAARAEIRSIASESELEDIARNAKSWRYRADAAYRLMDESTRQDIFAKDADWHVKAAALVRSIDGSFIERVACDENEQGKVRYVAVLKLRDLSVIERLTTSASKLVREAALLRLNPAAPQAANK